MHLIAIALGGALGALSRYGLSVVFMPQPGKFPVATFVANTAGCFIMGMLYLVITEKAMLPPIWRSFLMVGALGAFTTFSSFSLESFNLWHAQNYITALVYTSATLCACLLAVSLGYGSAKFIMN